MSFFEGFITELAKLAQDTGLPKSLVKLPGQGTPRPKAAAPGGLRTPRDWIRPAKVEPALPTKWKPKLLGDPPKPKPKKLEAQPRRHEAEWAPPKPKSSGEAVDRIFKRMRRQETREMQNIPSLPDVVQRRFGR